MSRLLSLVLAFLSLLFVACLAPVETSEEEPCDHPGDAGVEPPSDCNEQSHVLLETGECVWSCGEGTTPDMKGSMGQCVCKEGLTERGTDSFGRRTCYDL